MMYCSVLCCGMVQFTTVGNATACCVVTLVVMCHVLCAAVVSCAALWWAGPYRDVVQDAVLSLLYCAMLGYDGI